HIHREDRQGLSQLITYMARPPSAEERLTINAAGDIEYKLRLPWADGTTGIKLSPSELIEKLIALIPTRGSPLVRYGGGFAPNFKRRDEIILCPGQRKRKVSVGAAPCAGKSNKVKVGGGSWDRLLRKVFSVDVSKCPRCGADLQIISAVLDSEQISRYLKYVGMPAAQPPRAGIKMKVLCDDWC
ncbi:MAG: transposase, partial [Proteobacteria bacterium]|nr:transposase [Pseudomonadota bacterium]